jgi:hypothetical protein
MTAIGTALLSAVAAFIGSWLAARLALDRFRHEKIWEMRAAAYTAIFELLQEIELRSRNESEGGHRAFIEARETLNRRLASAAWLLSDKFSNVVGAIERDARRIGDDCISYSQIVSDVTPELRGIARSDLSVEETGSAEKCVIIAMLYYRWMKRRARKIFRGQFR